MNKNFEYKIQLKENKIIKAKQYQLSTAKIKEVNEELQKWFD